MSDVWLVEFRRRYIKGDKFCPDFVIGRHNGESSGAYAARVQETVAGKNHRAINFDYRAQLYSRRKKAEATQ